jgi:selenocysteine lyase/cysteine desulfurase
LADVHVDSIRNYLLNTNVQLGATYKVSQASTAAYSEAYKVAAGFINARPEEVIRIVLEDEECKLTPYKPCM